jgi:hypothetical protein
MRGSNSQKLMNVRWQASDMRRLNLKGCHKLS